MELSGGPDGCVLGRRCTAVRQYIRLQLLLLLFLASAQARA